MTLISTPAPGIFRESLQFEDMTCYECRRPLFGRSRYPVASMQWYCTNTKCRLCAVNKPALPAGVELLRAPEDTQPCLECAVPMADYGNRGRPEYRCMEPGCFRSCFTTTFQQMGWI